MTQIKEQDNKVGELEQELKAKSVSVQEIVEENEHLKVRREVRDRATSRPMRRR